MREIVFVDERFDSMEPTEEIQHSQIFRTEISVCEKVKINGYGDNEYDCYITNYSDDSALCEGIIYPWGVKVRGIKLSKTKDVGVLHMSIADATINKNLMFAHKVHACLFVILKTIPHAYTNTLDKTTDILRKTNASSVTLKAPTTETATTVESAIHDTFKTKSNVFSDETYQYTTKVADFLKDNTSNKVILGIVYVKKGVSVLKRIFTPSSWNKPQAKDSYPFQIWIGSLRKKRFLELHGSLVKDNDIVMVVWQSESIAKTQQLFLLRDKSM